MILKSEAANQSVGMSLVNDFLDLVCLNRLHKEVIHTRCDRDFPELVLRKGSYTANVRLSDTFFLAKGAYVGCGLRTVLLWHAVVQ